MPSLEELAKNREAYVKLTDISTLFDSIVPLDRVRLFGENIMIIQTFEHGIMFKKEYGTQPYYYTNTELLNEADRWKKLNPNGTVIKHGWYKKTYIKK